MAAPDSYEVKIWDTRDAGVIPELLASASAAHGNPKRSPQWFSWKFRESPWGPATVAYAQTDQRSGRWSRRIRCLPPESRWDCFRCWHLL